MPRALKLTTLLLVGLVVAAHESRAASYGNYTDPTGTVSYLNVRDVNGLFGAPSVSLDSIDFTPTQYQAACSQCPAGVSTSDTLSVDIQSITGREITQIEITEGLDFTLQSLDANGFAAASVLAGVVIRVDELNGVAVSGISANVGIQFNASTSPSVTGVGILGGIILGSTGLIDIQQMILNAGFSGDATRVSVDFGNTLTAFHDGALGSAVIRKRDADFVSLTAVGAPISNTPEPTTAVLLMGGLALLAVRRPRD